MIKTSDEGTSYCPQCEVYAREIESLKEYIHDMTDAKPMTAEDKISDLFDKYEVDCSADMFDEIHQVIKQACDGARAGGMQEIRESCSQHQHNQYADGYAKGFADAREKMDVWDKRNQEIVNATESGLRAGFREAIEKAAKIAEFHSGPSIQLAERIRALTPGEGVSKCGCEENHKMHPRPSEGACVVCKEPFSAAHPWAQNCTKTGEGAK